MVSELHALDLEQTAFHGEPAAESANRAITGNHTVARDDDGNRIRAAGRADRP